MSTVIYAWLPCEIRMATVRSFVYVGGMNDKRSIALHVRLTEEQHAAVLALAEREDRKLAAMLALLVKEALAARRVACVGG